MLNCQRYKENMSEIAKTKDQTIKDIKDLP